MIREKIKVMADKWNENQKTAFISCILIGLMTHGYMYFNKLSWHDDMTLTHIGSSYAVGRWFLGVIEWAVNRCGGYYSLPVLQGCASLFFIALAAVLVVDMLKITKKILVVLTAGIMIAVPVMTALYAYMFTAAAYSLSIFLCILGIYCTWKIRGIQGILLGMGAICLGIGCYQAYIAVAVCMACMILYLDIVDSSETEWKILGGGI